MKEDDSVNEFEPIAEPDYHSIPKEEEHVKKGQKEGDEDYVILEKTSRDMTGTLRSMKHTLLDNSTHKNEERSAGIACKRAPKQSKRGPKQNPPKSAQGKRDTSLSLVTWVPAII